ncbi:endonuclease domain-containing protein [uncultured Sphingomonas sp.]|uniref:endonuclease domain-containing protein n=1 Tax=uncultured Sphingomonas sp. TaxID=158754 RepID=UPI00345C02A6
MILPATGRGTGEAGGGGAPRMLRPEVSAARRLRRDMPLPEVQLWQRLCGSPRGVRFRRQHPIGPYVVDFYCAKASLVFEIDGMAHDCADRPARDALRDAFLTENGHRVVRIAAARVLADAQATADAIVSLAARPLHRPADGPPPRAGEDL